MEYQYIPTNKQTEKDIYSVETTVHASERYERFAYAIDTIGLGEIISSFIVDKGHHNGPEIHNITSTGLIIIQNLRTKKIVTVLIARPGQIRRYYEFNNADAPKSVIKVALEHQKAHLNRM